MENTEENAGKNAPFEFEQIEGGLRLVRYHGSDDEKEIMIPGFADRKKVIEVGPYAFYHSENLEKIFFAEGIRTIGEGAFSLCKNLKVIGLPDSLKKIEPGAFFGCGSAEILPPERMVSSARDRCPVCRSSTADGALVCPECGFGSEGYPLRLRLKERKEEEEARRKEEEERQLKKRQENTVALLKDEQEDSMRRAVLYSLGFLACLIASFWMVNPNGGFTYIGSATVLALAILAVFAADIALLDFAVTSIRKTGNLRDDMKTAQYDIRRYDRLLEERKKEQKQQEELQKQIKIQQQEQYNREHPHPKCPMCGSYNTCRIPDSERILSTEIWGLGSDKIGKQYECLDCKHKW